MNFEQKIDEAASNIQPIFSIPVRVVKPKTHNCISCGFETDLSKGRETYDTVTERDQFFCADCHSTSLYAPAACARPKRCH